MNDLEEEMRRALFGNADALTKPHALPAMDAGIDLPVQAKAKAKAVTQRKQQDSNWLLFDHDSLRQTHQILLSTLASYCEHFRVERILRAIFLGITDLQPLDPSALALLLVAPRFVMV